jgi:hemerythrin
MDKARKGEDIKKIMNEAASYSGEWLMKHILVMDKKYTKFLQEHGVK